MFHAMIVDDEKPALDILRIFLEKTGQVCVVGAFTNGADALAEMRSLKPDVAFLDIEMSDMSGLELAEKIMDAGSNIEIVFVTAYDRYALEAFRVNAIDYILKPFSPDDIAEVITRLKKVKPLAVVSQMPADKGRIYCFGRLSVYGAECREAIKWRTAKTKELFAFMLQNLNSVVSKWKIMEAIWPECDVEKQLKTNLYTTVYNVKKTLSSVNIKFDFSFINGSYKLELSDVYIDVSEFEALTDTEITVSAASIAGFKKIIGLYKGNYLEDNAYHWAQSKAEEYAKRYRRVVSEFAGYYIHASDYPAAENILRKALAIIPCDDELNEMLLKLYLMKKDKASIVAHYNKIKELYRLELGITPNMSMQKLFDCVKEL